MSEKTQSNNQNTIVIALVVVAVLLAALVGVLIYQQAQAAKTAQLTGASTTTDASSAGANSAITSNQTAAEAPFDPKTATKVPAGMTPEQLVKAYNEDVVAGKYDAAFKLLPAAVQTKTYGDAKSYAEQLKAYGISGYKMGKPSGSGDTQSIVAEQQTSAMAIAYTWNFKKVNGEWYVVSRVMGGQL